MPDYVDAQVVAKWTELVNRIEFGTMKDNVIWKRNAEDDEIFANIGRNSILFGRLKDQVQGDIYYIKVMDKFGQVIEEFNDEDIDKNFDDVPYFSKMRNLFNMVMRKLTGADAVLDELISALPDPNELSF